MIYTIFRQVIIILNLILLSIPLFSQRVDTIFGCDDIPPPGSGASCSICNFDILYGSTFPFTASAEAGWCGTIENDQYIGFVAGPNGSVAFEMTTFNCTNGQGLQVGIYDESNSLVGDCFNQVWPGTPQFFAAGGLTPGEIYYMRIDGFAGDGCEFNIQVISGLINAGPDAPGPILGPQDVCWDDTYPYSIIPVPNATSYYWRVTPGPWTSGVSVDPQEATDPLMGTSDLGIDLNIPQMISNMPPGTCDEILIEVFPQNPCFASRDSSTFLLEICASTKDSSYVNGTYLHCEEGFSFGPYGVSYKEGIHHLDYLNENGQFDCESYVELTVERIGDPFEIDVDFNNFSCDNNGYFNLDISGGELPYSILWSNGSTGISLSNLDTGNYVLTIQDNIGCVFDSIYRIRDISEEVIPLQLTGADCNGDNGSARLDTSIVDNYQILWSTGETGISIDNLSSNRYGVTIIDSINGCQLDSFFHVTVNPTCFSLISGNVVSDVNIDCQDYRLNAPLNGALVTCSNGQSTFTDQAGAYSFSVDTGTYIITITNPRPTHMTQDCSISHTVVASLYEQNYNGKNFFFERIGSPDISLSMIKQTPSRGRSNTIHVNACNFDSLTASFSLQFRYTDQQHVYHTTPSYTSIDFATNTITWEVVDLESFECQDFKIYLQTKVSTMVGDTIMYMTFTDTTTTLIDTHPIDNEISCKAVVIGSYDPNDKLVTPLGRGEEGIIELTDSLLQYTIRFQNTGSDDAWYVRLEDQISENLDIRSMKVIGASHDYSASFNEDRNLIVLFDPIILPPASVDSMGSQGYFSFTIETMGELMPSERIENTANIYFDFNDPIITNTTVNTINFISSTNEVIDQPGFVIYPNPNQGELTVRLNEEHVVKSMHLISIDGRSLPALDFQGAGKEYKLNLKSLGVAQGIYTLRLTLASGETVHRLFVLRP